MREKRATNIIVSRMAEEELQILDERFRKIIDDATRRITNIQNNKASAADNSKNYNKADSPSNVPPLRRNSRINLKRGGIWQWKIKKLDQAGFRVPLP